MTDRNRSERSGRGESTSRRESAERSERGSSRDSGRGSSRSGFKYHKPSAEDVKKRAEQSGSDFDSIFKDTVKVFKVNDGDNLIRVLPATWEDPKHFGLDIFVHYGIGPDRQSYLCLKEMNHGDGECPICEERAEAVKNGEDDYAKELKPSKRVLVYLVDRDAEKEGVQAWAAPWTVDRDINSLIVDKRSGEVMCIDDPDNGYDVSFSKQGKQMTTKYIGMQIARRESDLGNDDWLQFAVDNPLPEQLKFFDYDYIKEVFNGKSSKKSTEKESDGDRDDRTRDRDMKRGQEGADKLTWDEVHAMTFEELGALIDDENMDIKADDSKDDEELADWVCEDLKISKRAARETTTRRETSKEKEPEPSARDKLKALRRREE